MHWLLLVWIAFALYCGLATQAIAKRLPRVQAALLEAIATAKIAKRLPRAQGELLTPPFGKLTQFWAQQAAGIPEGHAFIRTLEQQNFSFATPQLGVLDTGFVPASLLVGVRLAPQLHSRLSNRNPAADDRYVFVQNFPNHLQFSLMSQYARTPVFYKSRRHGSAIAHLLASNTAAGVSLKGELAMLLPLPKLDDIDYRKAVRELIAALPLPQIINYSLRLSKDEELSARLATSMQLLAAKTILVMSAGNKAPAEIEAGKQKLASQAIIVGSADPTGQVSSFSQTGCAETIRACSDKYIQSVSPRSGEFFNFGGTSAAAPLVSAALADALSILPNLSLQQAKLLLQNTALANSSGDEIGLLNYFKLLRVAHRLVERGWSPAAGAEEVLHNPALYDFRAEAEQLTQEAMATTDNDAVFLKLRQAFFLDDNNSTARAMLAAFYRQHGYEAQAFFYDNPKVKARDAFIAHQDQQQKAVIAAFLAALAEVDTEMMLTLIPDLNVKELFKESNAEVVATLQSLSPTDRTQAINFLQAQALATVKISDTGEVTSVKRILE